MIRRTGSLEAGWAVDIMGLTLGCGSYSPQLYSIPGTKYSDVGVLCRRVCFICSHIPGSRYTTEPKRSDLLPFLYVAAYTERLVAICLFFLLQCWRQASFLCRSLGTESPKYNKQLSALRFFFSFVKQYCLIDLRVSLVVPLQKEH